MIGGIERLSRMAGAAALAGALALLSPLAASAADKPAARQASPPPAAAPAPPPEEGVEGQIAELRQQLKITPAQETQFNAVAEVLRTNARELETLEQQNTPTGKSTAVDDLRAFQRFTELQAEGLKRLVPAFQALYDSLSEQQKQVADSTLGLSGPAPAQAPPPPPPPPAPKKRG